MANQKRMNFKKLEVLTQNQKCVFCHTSEINEIQLGPVYTYQKIITHYYCLLLSSDMQQNGRDSEGILGFLASDIRKEIRRGSRLHCTYCKKSGATLGCDVVRCKVVFHLPCGIQNNTLHQFFSSFKSFCQHHRPVQKVPREILQEAVREPFTNCTICCESIEPRPVHNTLWAPCCKKNAWFHRDCVQKLATNAGYFFKCPLCNNKEEFRETMRNFGIYIPEQDASWESVPNAFGDLYYRHDSCDAMKCLCPQGRKDNVSGTRWELVLCRLCGSQGMHIGCGKLVWVDPVWECNECKDMLQNAKENPESDIAESSNNIQINNHERYAAKHPSVSSDRVEDVSEEEKEHSKSRRKRRIDYHQKALLPSTSKTYVIPDSPKPDNKRSTSPFIVIDDSDDDDDIVVVSSHIPVQKSVLTKEGREIPVVCIKEETFNSIEVPVQIKMSNRAKKPNLVLNNNNVLFKSTNVQSKQMLQDPSSSLTPQHFYGQTYVLERPQTGSEFPSGTNIYQSIPQEYVQNNQSQQQLGASRKSDAISCHPDICQYGTRCSNKPNHGSAYKYTAAGFNGKRFKLFTEDSNESHIDRVQYVTRLGYNYTRLNPRVVISPLEFWNDKGNIKIVARNNYKRNNRLKPCTKPTKKPKLDVNLRKEEKKKIKKSSQLGLKCTKFRLQVKMFGQKKVTKGRNKENNLKLIENDTPSICGSDNKKIQFPVLKNILTNSTNNIVNNNIVNTTNKGKEDETIISDSLNFSGGKAEETEMLDNFYESNTFDHEQVLADDKPNDNNNCNISSTLCNQPCDDGQENKMTHESVTPLINKDQIVMKSCLTDGSESCTLESESNLNPNSVPLTQKQKKLTSSGKSRKSDAIKIKKKLINKTSSISKNANFKFYNCIALNKQQVNTTKQVMTGSNFGTLDKYFNFFKPIVKPSRVKCQNVNIKRKKKTVQQTNVCHSAFGKSVEKENSKNKKNITKVAILQNSIEKYLCSFKNDVKSD